MKTVIDAVNEFKGDFDNEEINGWEADQDQIIMANKKFDQFEKYDLTNGSCNFTNEYWTVICTREEFNQCVKEMTQNPKPSKPVTEDKISCFVCHVGAFPMQQYCGSCGHELLSELIPVTLSPVFTQDMFDAGESLDIGMMFATEAGEYHVDNINDKSICFIDEDGFFIGIPIGKAKPIDTRTDSEKAFDKFLSDQYNSNIAEFQGSESDVDFITGLQSAWKAAINFQLLTVEVK